MSELRDNVIMHINFCKQADNPVSDNHHADEIIALFIEEALKVVDAEPDNLPTSSSLRQGYIRCVREKRELIKKMGERA